MVRTCGIVLAGAALLVVAGGCRLCQRDRCDLRPGVFSSRWRTPPPAQLTSQPRVGETCYDALTGQPIPCPPVPGDLAPPTGGTTPSPPLASPPSSEELPPPGGGDHIRPPGVPSAPTNPNTSPSPR
ncbi:MAG: hypothetical protein NZ703_05910 [Gemmataceae bacterium]|nr:hypothetical protein [Gemmataceae bacterium]MCS7270602.1 hypothetical protein [Gemmataceae bacterium]MDW8243275.1 hypothetical protein [Thermogemmata sp.]